MWSYTHQQTSCLQKKKSGGKENVAAENAANTSSHASTPVPGTETAAAGPALEPKAAERTPVPRSEVVLPLEPYTLVDCIWRDERKHPARIVERRKVAGGEDEYEYYVHYRKLNRRLDEWVKLERLDLDTVIPPEPVDPNDPKYVILHFCILALRHSR